VIKKKNKKIKKNEIYHVVNMTPHDIILIGEDGIPVTFLSQGVIRLSKNIVRAGTLTTYGGIPVPITESKFGEAVDLPSRKEDTIYIVSSLVCQAYPDRPDFYIPDQLVRDEKGRVIGCKSLTRNPFYKGGDEQ